MSNNGSRLFVRTLFIFLKRAKRGLKTQPVTKFFATEYTEHTEKCRNFFYFLINKLSSETGPVPQSGIISVA